MMEDELGKLIIENWQVIFLYGLKQLNDIKKVHHQHDKDIAILKDRETR